MKVIEPTPLMREAASVLAPIVDDVVVIGAVAVAVVLSDTIHHSNDRPLRVGAVVDRPPNAAVHSP
jgi:hypothetical protein